MEIQPGTPPQQWPDGPACNMVISLSRSRPIAELCVIRQRRVLRKVYRGKCLIGEMSLDSVDMGSAGQLERSYEVEIELEQDGTLEDLQVLDKILRSYGLSPESRSKFERAMVQLEKASKD
jgi:inorganic triphosphatase YgiF